MSVYCSPYSAMLSREQQASKEALKAKTYKDQERIDQLRLEQAKLTEVLEGMHSQEQHNEE